MVAKSDYQVRLGERLRAVRTQQDLTLQQVEERSDGKWKAVVIGAYERGDRAISAAKLADLADFYGIPVSELLPETQETTAVDVSRERRSHVVLDLTRLEGVAGDELEPVSRFAYTIQRARGDYNGRVLTLRDEDVRALAVVLGLEPEEFVDQLADRGILASR
jgi:transcriptional regulator with XRE-family HTH domain